MTTYLKDSMKNKRRITQCLNYASMGGFSSLLLFNYVSATRHRSAFNLVQYKH